MAMPPYPTSSIFPLQVRVGRYCLQVEWDLNCQQTLVTQVHSQDLSAQAMNAAQYASPLHIRVGRRFRHCHSLHNKGSQAVVIDRFRARVVVPTPGCCHVTPGNMDIIHEEQAVI